MSNTTNGKRMPGPRDALKKWMVDSRPLRKANAEKRLNDSQKINFDANKFKWSK